jgi:hypothetical protein
MVGGEDGLALGRIDMLGWLDDDDDGCPEDWIDGCKLS